MIRVGDTVTVYLHGASQLDSVTVVRMPSADFPEAGGDVWVFVNEGGDDLYVKDYTHIHRRAGSLRSHTANDSEVKDG